MTQQLYVLVFIIEILRFTFIKKPIHEYLLPPPNGNNSDIFQWMIKQTTICPAHEFCSAAQRNELLVLAITRMNHQKIILNEKSQYPTFHDICFHSYNFLEITL